jgi:hypothetical protein
MLGEEMMLRGLYELVNGEDQNNILRNCHVCLYGSKTSHYFEVIPPTLYEYMQFQFNDDDD